MFPLFLGKPTNDYFHQMSYRKVTFVLKLTLENLSVYETEIDCETQNMPSTFLVAGEKGCGLLDHDWLSSLQLDWKTIMNLQDTSLQNVLQ